MLETNFNLAKRELAMMKNIFLTTLGVLSLLGVTAIAAEEKSPATVEKMTEKMAEKVMASPELAVDDTVTMTAQVQAVDLKKREVTLKDEEGNVFTIDVPPEVRRLPEIKPGDLVVARYSQALALGLDRTGDSTGIQVRRESTSVERAGKNQPPGAVARENVEVLAKIIAIDKAKRRVIVKGAQRTVVLKVPEDIDLNEMKPGDEVVAKYVQELAINLEPAPPTAAHAWKAK